MTPRTLVDIFRNLEKTPKPDLLLVKKSGDVDSDLDRAIHGQRQGRVVRASRSLGVKQGGRVALLSENRPEWSIVDFACQCYGAVLVPIFPTMVADQVAYLLKDSGRDGRVRVRRRPGEEDPRRARGLGRGAGRRSSTSSASTRSSLPGVDAVRGPSSRRGGRRTRPTPPRSRSAPTRGTPDDLATFIYTSGTTGEPKGAMLTQQQLRLERRRGAARSCRSTPRPSRSRSFLSRTSSSGCSSTAYYHRSATIAYAESIDKLRDNMGEVNPHLFGAVPRVYEKIYARVQENLAKSSPGKRKLFAQAIEVGKKVRRAARRRSRRPTSCLALQHFVFERLVYRKVRAALGSRFRFAVSGGAPLARELAEFFWAIGVEIYEGYGLTETSPVIAVNCPSAWRLGTVGKILPGVECRIAPDGEILTRGPHVMKGYYNKPKETAEAIDSEGWFHTGDIGRPRRGRLPRDHGPQEGDPRQLERQEHRPGADRELPQGPGLRLPAGPHRRQAGSSCPASSSRTSRSSRRGRRRTASPAVPWTSS